MMESTSPGVLPGNFTKRAKTDCEGRQTLALSLTETPSSLRKPCDGGLNLSWPRGIRGGIDDELLLPEAHLE